MITENYLVLCFKMLSSYGRPVSHFCRPFAIPPVNYTTSRLCTGLQRRTNINKFELLCVICISHSCYLFVNTCLLPVCSISRSDDNNRTSSTLFITPLVVRGKSSQNAQISTYDSVMRDVWIIGNFVTAIISQKTRKKPSSDGRILTIRLAFLTQHRITTDTLHQSEESRKFWFWDRSEFWLTVKTNSVAIFHDNSLLFWQFCYEIINYNQFITSHSAKIVATQWVTLLQPMSDDVANDVNPNLTVFVMSSIGSNSRRNSFTSTDRWFWLTDAFPVGRCSLFEVLNSGLRGTYPGHNARRR